MDAKTLVGLIVAAGSIGCGGGNTPQADRTAAPGAPRSGKTAALETGAAMVQDKTPVEQFSMYLVGFHPAKADPSLQMESHHYCNQVNDDFAQCVLFDGNTKTARLRGIEYIISAKLYATLPAQEKPYWHPHNYEILSGELRMPGLPDAVEQQALATKVNSYGKTWHVWNTGGRNGGDALPLGPPHLAWSFNHDGELDPELLETRDARMKLDTTAARQRRAGLAGLARPQGGVDALRTLFPNAGAAPAGVTDNGDAATRPVPVCGVESGRNTSRNGQ